jgi:hypothetical protein
MALDELYFLKEIDCGMLQPKEKPSLFLSTSTWRSLDTG